MRLTSSAYVYFNLKYTFYWNLITLEEVMIAKIAKIFKNGQNFHHFADVSCPNKGGSSILTSDSESAYRITL